MRSSKRCRRNLDSKYVKMIEAPRGFVSKKLEGHASKREPAGPPAPRPQPNPQRLEAVEQKGAPDRDGQRHAGNRMNSGPADSWLRGRGNVGNSQSVFSVRQGAPNVRQASIFLSRAEASANRGGSRWRKLIFGNGARMVPMWAPEPRSAFQYRLTNFNDQGRTVWGWSGFSTRRNGYVNNRSCTTASPLASPTRLRRPQISSISRGTKGRRHAGPHNDRGVGDRRPRREGDGKNFLYDFYVGNGQQISGWKPSTCKPGGGTCHGRRPSRGPRPCPYQFSIGGRRSMAWLVGVNGFQPTRVKRRQFPPTPL